MKDTYTVYKPRAADTYAAGTFWPVGTVTVAAAGGWEKIARDAVAAGRITESGRYVLQNDRGRGLAIVDVTFTPPTVPTVTVEVVS